MISPIPWLAHHLHPGSRIQITNPHVSSELQASIVNSLPDTSHVSGLIHIKQRLDSSHPNVFFTNFPILVSHTAITQLLKPKITFDSSLSLTLHLHSVANLTASIFKIQPILSLSLLLPPQSEFPSSLIWFTPTTS